jgi:DNA repair protein RecN (Recombination protein N)
LENADELRALASGIATALEGGDEAVLQALAAVSKQLATIQRIDPSLARLQETFDAAYYAIEALAHELEEYEASVELDPARLDEVRRRRDLLFRLSKKYGGSIAEAIRSAAEARAELDLLDSGGFDLKELETREQAARARLMTSARS